MKLALSLGTTVILLIVTVIAKYQQTELDGNWTLKDFNYDGNKGTSQKPDIVKIFEEGKFNTYVLYDNGASKTTEGTFKVLPDNIYTETIVKAVNAPMIGKTYRIKYQIVDSLMLISSSYDSPAGKVNYSETWVRFSPKIFASVKAD
jgi:hypothetical protein